MGGTQTTPGSGGGTAPDRGPGWGGGGGGGTTEPEPEESGWQPPADCGPSGVLCREGYTVELLQPDVDELPAVTASDLSSFRPADPAFEVEPGGVGIVGMPTNFVAQAGAQVLAGTLFDRPVSVRFVPTAYLFDYGDGAIARSNTGGASWTSLGQPQFTATPTSHAYGARGTYSASVAVEYAAAVDFGTGWLPVIGAVTTPGGTTPVTVYEARTALVDRTCGENPSGPGC
ncbi:hypothetical protein [Microbacterium sp. P04]|uniref:hypothetical protein n=1 Tax=Microbacterium sp. P04 TaxID=3366947 RepID=UPI003746CEB7